MSTTNTTAPTGNDTDTATPDTAGRASDAWKQSSENRHVNCQPMSTNANNRKTPNSAQLFPLTAYAVATGTAGSNTGTRTWSNADGGSANSSDSVSNPRNSSCEKEDWGVGGGVEVRGGRHAPAASIMDRDFSKGSVSPPPGGGATTEPPASRGVSPLLSLSLSLSLSLPMSLSLSLLVPLSVSPPSLRSRSLSLPTAVAPTPAPASAPASRPGLRGGSPGNSGGVEMAGGARGRPSRRGGDSAPPGACAGSPDMFSFSNQQGEIQLGLKVYLTCSAIV